MENGIYLYELKVPKDWCGKKLGQIDIRKKYKINVLTIKRNNEVIMPSAETVIQQDDVAFVLGESKDIHKIFKL